MKLQLLLLAVGLCACYCAEQETEHAVSKRWQEDGSCFSKKGCKGCYDNVCFCNTGYAGHNCRARTKEACRRCDDEHACRTYDWHCEECPSACGDFGTCQSTDNDQLKCMCDVNHYGPSCEAVRPNPRVTGIATLTEWHGYCPPCGGCGIMKQYRLVDGLKVGANRKNCDNAWQCDKMPSEKVFSFNILRRKLKKKGYYCCYSWANRQKKAKRIPVAGLSYVERRFVGLKCSDDRIKGYLA